LAGLVEKDWGMSLAAFAWQGLVTMMKMKMENNMTMMTMIVFHTHNMITILHYCF